VSEQLPAPDFDSHGYERPNQKWTCGHAAEGRPCRAGPSAQGQCQATSECTPVLEMKPGETKGRWRCTRPGGACESGPLPDGACCRPVPRCSPVPTLRTLRGRFTRAIVVATIGALLILLGIPSLRNQFINPGALSAAHSGEAFTRRNTEISHTGQTCAACHVAGAEGPRGLLDAAFHAKPGALSLKQLALAKTAEVTAIDVACQKCHPGHLLHQANVPRDVSCSFCHVEHRGPGSMAPPGDIGCAFCHSDAAMMAAAAAKGASLPASAFHSRMASGRNVFPAARPAGGFTQVIHSFAGDHPDFLVHSGQVRDPDTLKFGHALHLKGETIPKLPNGRKLDCAFCHQPDAAGVYFRPVNFENNCRVCHSLQFDPETPGLTLPHGDAGFVSAFLHSLSRQYSDFAARSGIQNAEAQRQFVQEKLARLKGRAASGEDFEQRVFFSTAMLGPAADIGSVSGTTRALYPGCAYCHEVKARPNQAPEITRPVLFERWLSHGRFDHSRHAKIDCAHCHAAEQSQSTADVILPGKSTCAECHRPRGDAPDSCATCHRYHTTNL
jgi:hypothetical protein